MTNFIWPVELRFDPSKRCLSPPKLHSKKQLVSDWYWIGQILWNSAMEIASIIENDFLTIEYYVRLHRTNNYKTQHHCSQVLEVINVKRWTQQIQIWYSPQNWTWPLSVTLNSQSQKCLLVFVANLYSVCDSSSSSSRNSNRPSFIYTTL